MNKKYDREKESACIFESMRNGLSARKACIKQGIPHTTFATWLTEDKTLSEQYDKARDDLHDYWADEIMDIADEDANVLPTTGGTDSGAVQKQRLRIDSRKWLLSKLASKRFGDKQTLVGDESAPLTIQTIKRKIIE